MGLDIYFYKTKEELEYFRVEIGYFRKVNLLVKYFNLENCVDHICPKEELSDLLGKCETVLKEHNETVSKELLPTRDGFFFGDTSYNEYYYSNVKQIADFLRETLKNLNENEDVIVRAWW